MLAKYGANAALANQTLVIAQYHADVRLKYHGCPGTNIYKQSLWCAPMMRLVFIKLALVLAVAACSPTAPSAPTQGADGRPLPKLYRIRAKDTAKLQFRMLDAVNALRSTRQAPPVELNPQLNAAAATHSRDMSLQNRPWHFGSDG